MRENRRGERERRRWEGEEKVRGNSRGERERTRWEEEKEVGGRGS